MSKVVHMTSVHSPTDVRILFKECQSLSDAGFEVVLIAPGHPCEVSGAVRLVSTPPVSNRLARMLVSPWRIARLAYRERADVYHFHDPELIPLALLLRLTGRRVIYDVHEDVPKQILAKHWVPGALRPALARSIGLLEQVAARVFNGIVAATPTIAGRFTSSRCACVQNYPIVAAGSDDDVPSYSSRSTKAVYIGGIADVRGAREMLEAVQLVHSGQSPLLELAGRFSEDRLERELRSMPGWKRVRYRGWLDRASVVDLLAESCVGLVVLHPTPNHVVALPVKLFEYMAAGIPVVASDFPLWRDIVESSGCGILVDPMNPAEIAGALTWLFEHPDEAASMGMRGRQAVNDRFNWSVEKDKLLSLYRTVLGTHGAA